MRMNFSILTLIVFTALVALILASRDSDLASLRMNNHSVLPLPLDSYPQIPGRWGLLNPRELPLDRVLYRQCKEFEDLSAKERSAVRGSITRPMESTLWEFARRSSVFALREEDPERIRVGLVALSMLPNQHDFRDVHMTMGLLRAAGFELGCDHSVFSEIEKICVPGKSRYNMGKMMRDVASRQPSPVRSNMFVETGHGIGYIRSDNGPYDPMGNLLSVSMEIARAIETVDPNYRARSFKIGQETSPTYWLQQADLDAEANNEIASAVQFQARIDPEIAKHQRFVVDLYRFNKPDVVDWLQAAADSQPSKNRTAILAVSHGDIFCIIGTRTYIKGGDTHESNETLKRFENKLKQILVAVDSNQGANSNAVPTGWY